MMKNKPLFSKRSAQQPSPSQKHAAQTTRKSQPSALRTLGLAILSITPLLNVLQMFFGMLPFPNYVAMAGVLIPLSILGALVLPLNSRFARAGLISIVLVAGAAYGLYYRPEVFPPPAASGINLLSNGSIEDTSDNWWAWGGAGWNPVPDINAPDGKMIICSEQKSTASNFSVLSRGDGNRFIKIEPGKTYILIAMIDMQNAHYVQASMSFYTEQGVYISTFHADTKQPGQAGQKWKKISTSAVTAPANAARLYFNISHGYDGKNSVPSTLCVDAIRIEEVIFK